MQDEEVLPCIHLHGTAGTHILPDQPGAPHDGADQHDRTNRDESSCADDHDRADDHDGASPNHDTRANGHSHRGRHRDRHNRCAANRHGNHPAPADQHAPASGAASHAACGRGSSGSSGRGGRSAPTGTNHGPGGNYPHAKTCARSPGSHPADSGNGNPRADGSGGHRAAPPRPPDLANNRRKRWLERPGQPVAAGAADIARRAVYACLATGAPCRAIG